jgi:hypothetical protein
VTAINLFCERGMVYNVFAALDLFALPFFHFDDIFSLFF